jgi:NADP-dependent 3-hydroxy acid dehydrogenase YdfG
MMGPSDGCLWVTGASAGIGRAFALLMARSGWTVVASARGLEGLQTLAEAAAGLPGRIVPMVLDITDRDTHMAVAERIRAEIGPIALAVLNAGTYQPDDALTLDYGQLRKTLTVNVFGTLNGVEAVLPAMVARGKGHLAIVASVAGYRGLPRSIAYSAGKAALISLCESLRFDLEPAGLAVSVITPGFVKTPLTDKNDFPMPFLISPELAAERMARGLARGDFEITFPRRFTWGMKLLRLLPNGLYFRLIGGMTRHKINT